MVNPDFKIPFNDLTNYVPRNLRNPVITSLIDNLFNRFLTHDESVPLYGYVGRKPISPDDRTPRTPQPTPERDINTIVPILSFMLGTERVAFTIQDLIKKAEAIGIAPGSLYWLYSQGNNYLPPINLDKFTNFFNYYWVAKAVAASPDMPWNPELLPEYYTIAAPISSDLSKLNVVAATTGLIVRTGTGFNDLSFEVEFTNGTDFTVTAIGALGAYVPDNEPYKLTTASDHFEYKVSGPAGTFTLVEFDVVRETIYPESGSEFLATFDVGDKFLIDVEFLTRNYTVAFTGAPGVKGKLIHVRSLNDYQPIDGVALRGGDRVLVKNAPASEIGIYIVSPGIWQRAQDDEGVVGSRTFVKNGTVNGGKLWELQAVSGGNAWINTGITESNTNSWQEGNYWVRSEDLNSLNLARSDVTQAIRPIIEYDGAMQLNAAIQNGRPSETGTRYKQIKTEFNQLPLFDLFRYDSTHSGLVSSVFYYEEDVTADMDLALQKRVLKSSNDSSDFVFNHGMADENGKLLFIKNNQNLHTIWHAGFVEPTIVDTLYSGAGNGAISNLVAKPFTQQQVWTITALTATEFKVAGSKMPNVPLTATVNNPYDNFEIAFTINAGSVPFEQGDSFIVQIGNLESTRYVMRSENGDIVDMFARNQMDTAGVGAWQIPRMFYNNPYNESRDPITEGALYSHFRGILANQLPNRPVNYSFGGSIKLWSEQQTLLAALLMQRDMTPISMIDLAQRQYATALNNVRDIYQQHIIQFLGDNGAIETVSDIDKLLTYILSIRALDNDVKTVLFDSTSPLVGFPATLPQLGIAPLVEPEISFDQVLGATLLTHHDGHKSPLVADDLEFRTAILGTLTSLQIKRSNGVYTGAIGSFTTAPTNPYRGEIWIQSGGRMLMYAIGSDTNVAPVNPLNGTFWYKRSVNELYSWNGTSWAQESDLSLPWTEIDLADTLNSLMLYVETKLWAGINPNARKYDFQAGPDPVIEDPAFKAQLKAELFSFAAINAYDPLAPDYVVDDAFTWNYSQTNPVNLPTLSTSYVPARWHNLLKAHQASIPGVIVTERPNNEPWKLLGFNDVNTWWSSLSTAQQTAYTPFVHPNDINNTFTNGGAVRVVQTTPGVTPIVGLIAIDGVNLSNGDRVLLVNEAAPSRNGIWIVSSGNWARSTTDPMIANFYVTASTGTYNKNTTWVLTATPVVGGPRVFKQIRQWTSRLWDDIKAARPGLRISVNPMTDTLLPPYVSSALNGWHINALTNFIPPGPSLGYEFGQDSPVETVWRRSPEYHYSLARALFRFDPLAFLGFCWGFNWVEVDGILYDGFDMQMPGHKRFRLHGELIDMVPRPIMVVSGAGNPIVATYTAYDSQRKQNFTITQGGLVIGFAQEMVEAVFIGWTFTIDDNGIPFRIGDRFEIANGVATFVPATTHKIMGFGQTFTHALRETSIDTDSSYAVSAYREWDINMGYRAGGLVASDDLHVYTNLETLSESAFSLFFKKNPIAQNEWAQALRIQVTQFGTDLIKKDSGYAPETYGADWIFRIEGYNPRYLAISYYTLSDASSTTFHALTKEHTDLPWVQPRTITGIQTTNLPITITGIQNVINFLFGYALLLESRGWEFNKHSEFNIDAETGRVRNFQLEIEKFVSRCYAGIELGQGHVVNPFIDRAWFNQETGLLAEFVDTSLFDITGHPGVFDTLGVKYKKEDLDIIRTNAQSSFGATGPMFSAHVQLDEFEHVFIFNNYSQPSTNSGVLYHPFSGGRATTYKFNGRKQATYTMRPGFGGHFLSGHEVHQNLQASTDNIVNFYDANHVFENETTTRHSLALLGFSTKDYFDSLDISNKTQFNFWRGLVQSKGTNLSIDAYLNNNRFNDAKIDEFWAYKVAEYGDSRQHAFPELKLTTDDALTQFTRLQFDSDTLAIRGFTTIDSLDESRWFSIDDMGDENVYFRAESVGNFHQPAAVIGETYKLPFIADYLVPNSSFTQVNATTIIAIETDVRVEGYGPSRPHFNPIKLFNYVENELVAEIPMWHPAIGQHTPVALENINIISDQNPAKYNYSTQVANNNTFDPLRPWGEKEIGRIWFDTRNLEYIPYYDSEIFGLDERLSRWGALADFSTIDIYEWVKSSVPPSEYNLLALVQAGDADLDPFTKAAGEVADQQVYSRDRLWFLRPVAWSFSPVPVNVDWEATPPFVGGSTDAELLIDQGVATLSRGTFGDYGIIPGMHIGAWNNDPINPKPLSEYFIEDFQTKLFRDAQGGPLTPQFSSGDGAVPAQVSLEVTGYSGINGQLLFSAPQISPSSIITGEDGEAVAWSVDALLRVTEIGSGDTEFALVSSAIGTIGAIKPVPFNPGQPFIAAVAGRPFRAPTPKVPAVNGYQIVLMSPGVVATTPTGLNEVGSYTSVIAIDGVTRTVTIIGSDTPTIGDLITQLNDAYPTSNPFKIKDGDIIVSSPTFGIYSTVQIGGDVFQALTNFNTIAPEVDGINEIAAIPGQSFIAAVAGQPYIPPTPEVIGVAAPYLFGAAVSVVAGEKISVELPKFGFTVVVNVTATGTYPVDAILNAIVSALDNKVIVRDAFVVTPIVTGVAGDLINYALSNPLDDADPRYGWRAWSIPTQADLDQDGQQPNSSWKPYVGDYQSIPGSLAEIKDAIAYAEDPLTLNNGVAVQRYETEWTPWSLLRNEKKATQASEDGPAVFTFNDNVDSIRASVYVNGIAQLKSAFTINGKVITVNNVPRGSVATVIIRKYEPTQSELAFDPAVDEDLARQQQFKKDYEYVSLPVRDRDGFLTSTLYYFWVKNKTTAAPNKKMSVQAIAQELRDGPNNFLTFQNFQPAESGLPHRYDAITVSGLSYIVTKNNNFKLRFTRNFTLRDNPEELNLKNIHTEWTLIRPAQKSRIPEALWQKLTDSVAGSDAAGNIVPAIRRVLYDERNGTRTQFGFGVEQTLAPSELLKSSISHTILNTRLVETSTGEELPDFITFLDLDERNSWFADASSSRKMMTDIWNKASITQVNEIFFSALNDVLANNYELDSIFKTSRLSAYSIKVITPAPAVQTYE